MFKKSLNDAKNFFKKGNILLLAVGFLFGVVFNAVVSSLANDIIMSAISKAFGAQSLNDWEVGGMLVGKFLGTVINFIIVSLVLFAIMITYFMIKNYKESRKPVVVAEPAPVVPTTEELILAELKELNQSMKSEK
ncbi:MscL family protein [Mycoplasma nasistruthionis]|uniref:MscL family protein n=1 Tax=Mycoplasma nasistruthionis TaxID=353852 RepID=A0A4Y6I5E9_9MOLU|nr:MscL family protein [Mycoplasma nasistruthionis]QCZ36542.1 MscL family protein [Mycoplasma nasistruthionis]QDF64836.1 MscL family protein [Mycoplasma nasistruthionis]